MDNVITRGPRDYVDIPWKIEEDWIVADIGPGTYPFYRADSFIDHDLDVIERVTFQRPDLGFHLVELAEGLPGIADNHFDYVWCSHVLEHVDDPLACARAISRVGKRGTLVLPSAIKESIFNFEEREHKWLILPHPSLGIPMFIGYNIPFMQQIKDIRVQQSTCRLFRTGSGHECSEVNILREWFAAKEKYLDVVYHWEGELEIMVIE